MSNFVILIEKTINRKSKINDFSGYPVPLRWRSWLLPFLPSGVTVSAMPGHKELLQEVKDLVLSAANAELLMQRITDRLHEAVPRYNWVGFYLVAKDDPGILTVGPHTGSFTPNIRIPLNRGLCGAAASTGKTVVVDDVRKDPRYIQGSDLVKSEMVVPMFANKKLVGELDVESYFSGTFNAREQEFVEACAALVAGYFEKNAH